MGFLFLFLLATVVCTFRIGCSLLSGFVLGFEIISIDIVDGVYRNWENPEHNLQLFAVAC